MRFIHSPASPPANLPAFRPAGKITAPAHSPRHDPILQFDRFSDIDGDQPVPAAPRIPGGGGRKTS
jgi:hypothetical protein